jgi:uncharacterized protein YbjT (DUF2867 family)
MTILVSGATGTVGSAVFNRLLAEGHDVRGGSRNPEKSGLPPERAARLDLDDPTTFDDALAGVDRVFLYAKTNDIQPFLDAALAAGRPHIVLLSAIVCGLPDADVSLSAQRHFALERPIEASGLPFTFVRPSDFATMPIALLDWMKSIPARRAVSMSYPDRQMTTIHELDIADVIVTALTEDGYDGATPMITGPQVITARQQIQTISEVLGEPIELTVLTPDEDRERLSHILLDGRIDSRLHEFERCTRDPYPLSDQVERITGHPARPYAQWVRDHIEEFR